VSGTQNRIATHQRAFSRTRGGTPRGRESISHCADEMRFSMGSNSGFLFWCMGVYNLLFGNSAFSRASSVKGHYRERAKMRYIAIQKYFLLANMATQLTLAAITGCLISAGVQMYIEKVRQQEASSILVDLSLRGLQEVSL
jgi:hypothetical protein